MRIILALGSLLALAGAVVAAPELGPQVPVKAAVDIVPNVVDPTRQGGDTIATAVPISGLPFAVTGTTAGYANNYDEMCPFDSNSPDVVYSLTITAPIDLDLDLCGSDYDTKIYVYASGMSLYACNDDFYFYDDCGVYVSKIENVPFAPGDYYVVIDGYGGEYGPYDLAIAEHVDCSLECPAGGAAEGEPPLQNDDEDLYNGGCSAPYDGFQDLAPTQDDQLILCGRSGWYLYDGTTYRDTDWYVLTFGPEGVIEMTADAEAATYLFELGPQDCAAVGVVQQIIAGPCNEAAMTITGTPGETVWCWAGPVAYVLPGGTPPVEYDYFVWFSGLEPAVATETSTWSSLKALYR